MLISIMDNDKLTKFNLPEKIEETYLIKYLPPGSKIEKDINIEAINGKWYLKSNGSVDAVVDNKIVDKVLLEEHTRYLLSVSGQKVYSILYCTPLNDETRKYNFPNLNTLSIGSSKDATISFADNLIAPIHATIFCDNNTWYIRSGELDWARVYVNNVREIYTKLRVGDVIFINGIKIIWMNNFIVVNNPHNRINFSTMLLPYEVETTIDNTKYSDITEDEENIPLYDDKDYFCHVPRLRTVFDEEVVHIDEPPISQLTEEVPIIYSLGASLMMIASAVMMLNSALVSLRDGKSLLDVWPQLLLVLAMIISSLLIPQWIRKHQAKKSKDKETLRQTKYTQYLNNKEMEIKAIMRHQLQVLMENYPNVNECLNVITNRTRRLWEKEIKDDDFLRIRLGLGSMPCSIKIEAPKEKFSLEDDNLKNRVFKIVENSKTLEGVPITFSFLEKKISAIIKESPFTDSYIDALILQLATYHSPADLKIVVLTNEKNTERWNYIKYLPHVWTEDREMRFFADDLEEMKIISGYLEKEFSRRKSILNSNDNKELDQKAGYRNFDKYYLIITDDYQNTKNIQFLSSFLAEKENIGFSLLLIDDSMRNMPTECNTFIDILENSSCVFENELISDKQITFQPEYNKNIDMWNMSSKLANIPVVTKEANNLLPTSISFLEMYNVGNIRQLNILNRWKTSNPVITLEAPIGIHPSGEIFKLNLHEKFQGPHGLIAGSTGSGKSEFIITYVLSMAVNYHPDDVQFVLIDYKGGGLAGAFENRETGVKIPHLAGTITNLDTNEMNRTLVSIESELKRRQAKFNEARDKLEESTIDIYKYQKYYHEGLLDEPISHLFIISDEFAELKSQQPEFMQQLISTSRIGRSLGVHLILATQKPSGVVNDQIWSNSRFKICLKVQSKSDSMEMLKRPEAASIKETGRFYLQVGYDELFEIGQSAWCGAKYIPTERIKKKQDDSIMFINNTGYVIKSVNDIHKKDENSSHGEQLTNIVKYLSDLAKKENYQQRQLWLNKIPEEIYLDNLKQKYEYKAKPYYLDPIIGEYDDPTNQRQDVLRLPISENGNTIVFGLPTTGKENLLATLIYSVAIEHTVDEVNFYILDFGAETLRMFNNLPHVGDIIFIEEEEKIIKLIDLMSNEIEKRKELFANYSGNYKNYCEQSGKKLPAIIIVLNAYENFQENYNRYEDALYTLIRESNKYGIYFVVSTSVNTCIRSRVLQNFNNRVSMQLAEPMDYRILLGAPKELNPSHNYGRGIVRIGDTGFEFQSAFITERHNINNRVKEINEHLSNFYKKTAPKIPILPPKVYDSTLPNPVSLKEVPVGLYKNDIQPVYYNFTRNKYNIIGTSILDDKLPFITSLIKKITAIPNVKVTVIDVYRGYPQPLPNTKTYSDNFELAINEMYNELNKEETNTYDSVYILVGAVQFKNRLSKEGQSKYDAIFKSIKGFKHSYFIAFDSYQLLRSLELQQWYKTNVSISDGIWLGEGFGTQSVIKASNFSLEDRKVMYTDIGYVVRRGKQQFIKYMVEEKKGEKANE